MQIFCLSLYCQLDISLWFSGWKRNYDFNFAHRDFHKSCNTKSQTKMSEMNETIKNNRLLKAVFYYRKNILAFLPPAPTRPILLSTHLHIPLKYFTVENNKVHFHIIRKFSSHHVRIIPLEENCKFWWKTFFSIIIFFSRNHITLERYKTSVCCITLGNRRHTQRREKEARQSSVTFSWKVKWIPIHFINNQIIKGVRPVIRDVMNVIFLVKVMLFVRISIETPPHHLHTFQLITTFLCIACEKHHLHDSNKILFPLMETSAAMNEKPKGIRKEEGKRRGIFFWENDKEYET